jgi:hypothetical protein
MDRVRPLKCRALISPLSVKTAWTLRPRQADFPAMVPVTEAELRIARKPACRFHCGVDEEVGRWLRKLTVRAHENRSLFARIDRAAGGERPVHSRPAQAVGALGEGQGLAGRRGIYRARRFGYRRQATTIPAHDGRCRARRPPLDVVLVHSFSRFFRDSFQFELHPPFAQKAQCCADLDHAGRHLCERFGLSCRTFANFGSSMRSGLSCRRFFTHAPPAFIFYPGFP